MTDWVDSIAALEACIGKTPPPVHLKVIDHIDPLALRWIAASPCLFAGVAGARGMSITLGGGTPGFVRAEPGLLTISTDALDDPAIAQPGDSFCSLFLLPGIGETLRVNGRVAACDAASITVAVEECYAHCAKALIRSEFWKAQPRDIARDDPTAFITASRFMALATVDAAGAADLSPKGDPEGDMVHLADGRLWFAERPGNRRADSLRNIVAQPRVAAILLVPGATHIVRLCGTARPSADAEIRAGFAVRDKVPPLATCIDDLDLELQPSAALARAQLWPLGDIPDLDAAKLFVAHLKINKDKGLQAKLIGAAVSIPGLMRKGLKKDYDTNLY
jgi:predicted pyridoxine 5'-phosphate oxidase superfamily flavin-nucleotide-binding protein